MNRELKFRVWDKYLKEMLSADKLDITISDGQIRSIWYQNSDGCSFGSSGVYADTSRYILQQYTGLKDKNDKEIYEGDIIKTTGKDIGSVLGDNPKYSNGEIKWLCQAWKICQTNVGATYLGDFVTCHCCNTQLEVIGNIFENPELLK